MIEPRETVTPSNVVRWVGYSCVLWVLITSMLLLSGCVAGVKPGTAAGNAQVVYQAESDYSAALAVAVAYRNLPVCGTGPVLCHEDKVVRDLQASDAAASAALKTAQSAVQSGAAAPSTINSAVSAVQAFSALAATLKVK
jgi:hypothetical protein